MMRFRRLRVAGALLALSLAIAACDSGSAGQSGDLHRAVPAATPPASPSATASPSVPTAAATTGDSPAQATSPAPPTAPASDAGFLKARAAWKQAASVSEAEMNIYFIRAVDDLRAAHNSRYNAAINELEYLINTPLTDVPPARRAKAEADARALDSFFGTPGLIQ